MQGTIVSYFQEAKNKDSNLIAIKEKVKNHWLSYNWQEYYKLVESLALGIHSISAENPRVAILADTCFKWSQIDLACLSIGGILIPIYSSSLEEDIEFILNDSSSEILFVQNKTLFHKWQKIAENCKTVQKVILMDKTESINLDNVLQWNDIIHIGKDKILKESLSMESLGQNILPDDIATIVYTSGTTGRPKGVVLRHRQIMSEVDDVFSVMPVSDEDTSLSFLPYAHILGRCEHLGQIKAGYTLAFAESIDKLRDNIIEIQPSFMVAVPRIFEKIHNAIMSAAEASPARHHLFKWALKAGKKVARLQQRKQSIPLKLLAEYKLADKLVFSKIKAKLGGNLRFAVSGGAPLEKEIGEFFHTAGILLFEGYGLTETTAAITLNTPFAYKFGTVGKPLADVQVKLAEDGEILAKSDKIMKEYYQNKEANEEVFTEGWFHTGDIGHFDEEGFIVITDRKKDLIKTAGGKYIAPQKLLAGLKKSKYITDGLIHGDKKKYIVALLTIDEIELKKYFESKNIQWKDEKEIYHHEESYNLIRNIVADLNSNLASYETIKSFFILDHQFSVEEGQLTPSLKVKRKFCDILYKSEIDKLYGPDKI